MYRYLEQLTCLIPLKLAGEYARLSLGPRRGHPAGLRLAQPPAAQGRQAGGLLRDSECGTAHRAHRRGGSGLGRCAPAEHTLLRVP